ncbi:MAG: alpha/beta fold hydrolase [Candidatus Helarchaeota archaeon]
MPTYRTPDGARLFYDIKGDGEKPIFFLHGWGISSAFFSEQVEPLMSNGYKIILLDSRMHGKSEKNQSVIPEIYKDNLLELMLDDFFNFKKELGIDGDYMLFGHSAGGAVSACIANKDPKHVKALAIINSSYTISENPAIILLWELVPLFVRALYNPYIRNGYKMVLRSKSIQYSLSLALDIPLANLQAWINDILTIPRQALVLEYMNLKRVNIKDIMKSITCPTLIVASDLDLITPAIMSKTIHELIHDSELHVIKNAGHLAMIEQKEEFNSILLDFLKRHY